MVPRKLSRSCEQGDFLKVDSINQTHDEKLSMQQLATSSMERQYGIRR